ncbi:coagulation factor IIIa isoform X3 [Phyllopteryx taeniolatus]|uniref:coagulation factor IIIa isoform X3 n=1 Tax=Phyllopteryx taeniolatus TaxID=161469 RepID=UPI002AD58BFD|nr:coagulation factor IIIa isoform X3 [Phyllopteryx taeniolatus]
MYFLWLLRNHGLPQELLRQFYTAVIESVLCSSITVWFGAATKKDKFRLQRTIKTAERIVGIPLPTLEELHAARTKTRACKILSDPPHPVHQLFDLLPSADIGRPDFKLEVSNNKKKTTLHVTDPLTALFKDDHQLNIRDIFLEKLHYKVTYRRNKSSGKKVFISKTSIIELTDLDQGESYCFNVQAFIPSRNVNKQLGELSQTQCSDDDKHSIFEVYSVGVIATAILLILVLIIITVVAIVCCRRKKTTLKTEKEGVPLQSV